MRGRGHRKTDFPGPHMPWRRQQRQGLRRREAVTKPSPMAWSAARGRPGEEVGEEVGEQEQRRLREIARPVTLVSLSLLRTSHYLF